MSELTTTKPYDDMNKEEQDAHDANEREREKAEQAALPYQWTQDLNTVTVTVPLPKGTRGKDLNVVMGKKKLKVQLKSSSEPILEGELFNDIISDDSSWTIDDSTLNVELEKLSAHIASHQWWPHVLTHHPKIDTTKIVPENSKLEDLDGETRGMVEKMMFDNRQKAMGKPTSDELKKQEMLEKFKKAHPEMDFSNLSNAHISVLNDQVSSLHLFVSIYYLILKNNSGMTIYLEKAILEPTVIVAVVFIFLFFSGDIGSKSSSKPRETRDSPERRSRPENPTHESKRSDGSPNKKDGDDESKKGNPQSKDPSSQSETALTSQTPITPFTSTTNDPSSATTNEPTATSADSDDRKTGYTTDASFQLSDKVNLTLNNHDGRPVKITYKGGS
ncbi:uncharacterized protein IL334_001332 [Kwoniella shivajii]|uniref:CS domain-containing protein n=1 Tax=Kwoniella shivajii TaxID=564305 RepID=A0ABZ1CT70_9TREE|nr:hypothetical protein IL334_001332 [Kwoniella shivajii]